jgi:hypothetical protein
MIPKAWNKEDYHIKWDTLYYKGEEMDFKIIDTEDDHEAYKRPSDEEDLEEGDYDPDDYFDCEEPEQD